MIHRATVLLCCALASAQVKPKQSPQPTILRASGEKSLNVPAFGFWGTIQSDSKGNAFMHVGQHQEVNILKISPSSETTVYRLPDAMTQSYAFIEFSVTPGGNVWALVFRWDNGVYQSGGGEYRLVEFNSDGHPKDPVSIDLPEDAETLNVRRFLVFDSGAILISGNYTEKAPAEKRGKAFVRIFNSSGTLMKNLSEGLPSSETVKLSGAGEIREGDCVAGDDGNAYFLGSDSIVSLTPSGEINKRIPFKKPAPDWVSHGIRVSSGWAAIKLVKARPDQSMELSFLVLDLSTGEVMGWYKPEYDIADVAFSPNTGFTFYRNDHGQPKLVEARLR